MSRSLKVELTTDEIPSARKRLSQRTGDVEGKLPALAEHLQTRKSNSEHRKSQLRQRRSFDRRKSESGVIRSLSPEDKDTLASIPGVVKRLEQLIYSPNEFARYTKSVLETLCGKSPVCWAFFANKSAEILRQHNCVESSPVITKFAQTVLQCALKESQREKFSLQVYNNLLTFSHNLRVINSESQEVFAHAFRIVRLDDSVSLKEVCCFLRHSEVGLIGKSPDPLTAEVVRKLVERIIDEPPVEVSLLLGALEGLWYLDAEAAKKVWSAHKEHLSISLDAGNPRNCGMFRKLVLLFDKVDSDRLEPAQVRRKDVVPERRSSNRFQGAVGDLLRQIGYTVEEDVKVCGGLRINLMLTKLNGNLLLAPVYIECDGDAFHYLKVNDAQYLDGHSRMRSEVLRQGNISPVHIRQSEWNSLNHDDANKERYTKTHYLKDRLLGVSITGGSPYDTESTIRNIFR